MHTNLEDHIMTTTQTTIVEAVRSMTNKEMVVAILELQTQVASLQEQLQTKSSTKTTGKEMTDDDARNVISGALSTLKHQDAADQLGLTYGQVYSARKEFTFKAIHAEMKKAGTVNPWAK